MDRFGLAYKERIRQFGWLRWMVGVNAVIILGDKVKTKRCNECCFAWMLWKLERIDGDPVSGLLE